MTLAWADAVPPDIEALSERIMDAAHRVHRHFGPGFRERVYEIFLVHALQRDGLRVEQQVRFPLEFEGLVMEQAGRADLIVEGSIVVEIKASEGMTRLHAAQVISYLKASGMPLGLLLNFNVPLLKEGYGRYVHPDLLMRPHKSEQKIR